MARKQNNLCGRFADLDDFIIEGNRMEKFLCTDPFFLWIFRDISLRWFVFTSLILVNLNSLSFFLSTFFYYSKLSFNGLNVKTLRLLYCYIMALQSMLEYKFFLSV